MQTSFPAGFNEYSVLMSQLWPLEFQGRPGRDVHPSIHPSGHHQWTPTTCTHTTPQRLFTSPLLLSHPSLDVQQLKHESRYIQMSTVIIWILWSLFCIQLLCHCVMRHWCLITWGSTGLVFKSLENEIPTVHLEGISQWILHTWGNELISCPFLLVCLSRAAGSICLQKFVMTEEQLTWRVMPTKVWYLLTWRPGPEDCWIITNYLFNLLPLASLWGPVENILNVF